MDYDPSMIPDRPQVMVTFMYDPRPMSEERSDRRAIQGYIFSIFVYARACVS